TSTISNHSVIPKRLSNSNSYTHSTHLTHTTTSISIQPPTSSIIRSDASKADLPYKHLAPLGVLSKIHAQTYGLSDSNYLSSTLGPLQGLPGAAQLDMNVSCLFMHELRHKYKHGEYEELQNISEEPIPETRC
ncbi:unnamed protein product, partial [Rotaria magnacalcarata]